MKHAAIIPLIGGEVLASDDAYGVTPEYMMTYSGFEGNEKHLRNHYAQQGVDVPYHIIDGDNAPKRYKKVDVVSSVCPCAGLSSYHSSYGEDNPNNQWMGKTAEYILGEYKPKVFWGENAPAFAGKIGTNVRAQLREIGKKNGYTMSVYRTRSLLHGAPQVRERSFYFFWKDTQTPLLGYFNRPHKPIEEVIREVTSNFQMEPISDKTPSDNPYYKFVLDEIHGGRTHKEHSELVENKFTKSGLCVFTYIERNGYNFKQVSEWMTKHGYDNEAEKSMRKYEKLKSGGNIMRKTTQTRSYNRIFLNHVK